jgi:hypothetical protein
VRLPRLGFVIVIYAALIAILIGVVVAGFTVLAPQWVAVASAVVPILIFFIASSQGAAVRDSPEDRARKLADELAPQIRGDWTAELPVRGLDDRRRMEVRWRRAAGSNPGADLAASLPHEGVLDQLTKVIGEEVVQGKLPRLVLTGEMGGGKTAACVLLVVELAERHTRLPVLFQLATWDPGTSVMAWMARQLPEIYPAVDNTKYGRRVATILVRRHILPILDGLDEVSDTPTALKVIDDELSGRPFVMTCRTAEFEAANTSHVLHQALIAELQPLRPDEVAAIFEEYEPPDAHGPLGTLVHELNEQPDGPVAEALSTPFMVSLARATRTSAAELPPDPVAIRQHLLGAFVQKVYADSEPFAPGQGLPEIQIAPGQAERYLRFLARHTDAAGRLAWWRLHRAVPRAAFLSVAVVVAGAVCSALAAGFFALFDRPWLGFWIGLAAGIAGAFIVELIPQDNPRRARLRFRSVRVPAPQDLARTLGFGFTGAAALAAMTWALYGPAQYTVIGAVLSGLTFSVARYISQPNDPVKVVTPISLLIADRATVMYAWLVGAIPGALTGFYLGWSFHAGHRASLGMLGILRYPSPVLALLGAAGGCVLSGAGLGLMATGSSAWGRFIWARIFLAINGLTPLGLMTFLRDAYRRGVLRQVNGYYEFRHRMLQRYLR